MSVPTAVHELRDDVSTCVIDRVRDFAPPGNVMVVLQPRYPPLALTGRRGPDAFGDDKPRRRALCVVVGHLSSRRAVDFGSKTCHRSHHNPVREPKAAEVKRFEE
jgi:hypothetical protein